MKSLVEFIGVTILCAFLLAGFLMAATAALQEWGQRGIVAATVAAAAIAAALVLYA